jgi:hypothetical protein
MPISELVHSQELAIHASLMRVCRDTTQPGPGDLLTFPRPASDAQFAYKNISHACALVLNVTYPQIIHNM